jgi:hypothetical protein
MSDLSAKHPQYTDVSQDWKLMRDAYKGERAVKKKGALYLPPTSAMIKDGFLENQESDGHKAYQAYVLRARFPNFVREAVQMAVGMMHSQPPIIKLPKAMEKIRGIRGEPLHQILRNINTEQLITGRVGLMADLPIKPLPGEDIPCISMYIAESIGNWDDGVTEEVIPQKLKFVVLDESEHRLQDGFNWKKAEKFRVLRLMKGEDGKEVYYQGTFEETTYNDKSMKTPQRMGQTLSELPFVIINSCDATAEVDDPPLLDLGNICMAIYRGEADYRQNLFMQGQDTFVTIGGNFDTDDKIRVGAGSRVDLPQGGDAKYVGVNSQGLSEQRQALERLESRAGSMGAQTLDSTSRERESGDSLRIRVAARTADMNQIVETGAFGLENLLKICAVWMGENPEEVQVTPNKEFGEQALDGQTMVEMSTARNLGFPISAKSMHNIARKRRLTELTFEEEIAEAKKEDEEGFVFKKADTGDMAGDQPNDDPDNPRSGKKSSNVPGQKTGDKPTK